MVQKEVEVTRGKVRSARRMVELVPGQCRAAVAEPQYKLRVLLNTNITALISQAAGFSTNIFYLKPALQKKTTITSDLKMEYSSPHSLKLIE